MFRAGRWPFLNFQKRSSTEYIFLHICCLVMEHIQSTGSDPGRQSLMFIQQELLELIAKSVAGLSDVSRDSLQLDRFTTCCATNRISIIEVLRRLVTQDM